MAKARQRDVFIVGGFGHIGLPFGIVLAHAGLDVGLYDVDERQRPTIEAGRMPFLEAAADDLLREVIGGRLTIADSLREAEAAESIVITIGTPVDEHLNPRLTPLFSLIEELSTYLITDQHVMLRSTVFPGTTGHVYEFLREHGRNVDVSFCPERIVQGHAIDELGTFPQIVSGITATAVQRAAALFGRLDVKTIQVTVQEAELAKLFTNAWRYIQFAIANQFYMMATERGADWRRVYHAMTQDYERGRDFPSAGFAAGPCLLKDTVQLSAAFQNYFQLGNDAILINEGLPSFVVGQIRKAGICLRDTRVGILGMAFKANIDDTRDSLSYKLAKLLRFEGAQVVCSDEYVADPSFVTCDELLASCPVVIVGVPHVQYRGLRVPAGSHVVDVWGVLDGSEAELNHE